MVLEVSTRFLRLYRPHLIGTEGIYFMHKAWKDAEARMLLPQLIGVKG